MIRAIVGFHHGARSLGVHRAQDARPYANRENWDLTADEQAAIDYLSTNFPPTRRDSRSSATTLLEGKPCATGRAIYISTPVSAGRMMSPWIPWERRVSQRTGKLAAGSKTARIHEFSIPPASQPRRQVLGNLQIDAKGQLWVPDGTNYRWLQYDINTGKFTAYDGPRISRRCVGIRCSFTRMAPSGDGRKSGAHVNTATKEFKFFDTPSYLSNA